MPSLKSGVVSCSCLRRVLESAGSIVLGHVQLDELDVRGRGEVVVGKELLDILLGLDLVSLVLALLGTKGRDEVLVLPFLDVVVSLQEMSA